MTKANEGSKKRVVTSVCAGLGKLKQEVMACMHRKRRESTNSTWYRVCKDKVGRT